MPPKIMIGPRPTPEEEKAQTIERQTETERFLASTGQSYSKEEHTFGSYDERSNFLNKLGFDDERKDVEGAPSGVTELPDARFVMVSYLTVAIYTPKISGA